MSEIKSFDEIANIYISNRHSLFRIALTYVDSLSSAEEIVADTIVSIFEQAPIFASEASCACYLKQIVRNKSISILRKKYKIEPSEDQDIDIKFIESNPYDIPYREVEIQLLLKELLKDYSPEIRACFIAHVLDHESIPALAEYYGIKVDTLRKQIRRMKNRLAKSIPENEFKSFLFMLLILGS